MTLAELAWEFADVFDGLDVESINEMLAKNVPMETLEFFGQYCEDFVAEDLTATTRQRLPNLMLIGYLLRILEERLAHDVSGH